VSQPNRDAKRNDRGREASSGSRPAAVLLVTDNLGDARLIEEMLRDVPRKRFGFAVVRDLRSAVARLAKDRVDVLLFDLSLPEGHDTETMTALRRSAPHVPIVLLAAPADEEIALAALEQGAKDYLVKGAFDAELLVRTIRHAVEHKLAEEVSDRSLSLLKATLESVADGIVVIDRSRTILHYNQRFAEMWSVPHSLLDAKDSGPLLDFMTAQVGDPQRLLRPLDGVLAEEEQGYDLLELLDGRIFERLSIPQVLQGDVIGRVWSFRDVTDRRHAIEELRLARQSAEAASRAKSRFLANLSHEIRTPLNAIVGVADLLGDTRLNSEQRDYVDTLRRACDVLLGLVGDVLDLSKIEAGRIELEEAPFSLPELVDDVIQLLQPTAAKKGLDLISAVLPEVPQTVVGDRNRLRQILLNLFGNAIKFTERGGVTARVENDLVPGMILFTVIDTGIGIPASRLASVFEDFEQADSTIGRQYGGTGLGLGIAKRLVELMGGRLWVESEPGHGSRFHFTARLEPPVAGPTSGSQRGEDSPAAGAPTAAPQKRRAYRILLADDSEDNRALFGFYLKHMPYQVDTADNGAVALLKFQSAPYDLVIVDLQMPVMDGYEAVRAIRQFEAENGRRPTPILALSAYAFDEKLGRSIAEGWSAFLTKPITREQFLAAIRTHLPE
jgi:signal transduction histidine kinase/DNA-binding response OmpR family regulator